MLSASATSEPYNPDNLLDRLTAVDGLEHHYDHLADRERRLLRRRLGISSGTVLSVGAGWHPGRHLFPAPDFQIVAVDSDPEAIAAMQRSGVADGRSSAPPVRWTNCRIRASTSSSAAWSYTTSLSRGRSTCVFSEAARLLRTDGALVAVEPNLWHPLGLALAAANKAGLANLLHGTPDDIPLSPARLLAEARAAGLAPELYGVTYGWRRLPIPVQRALAPFDKLGSRPRAARFAHTLMLIARRR